MKNNLTLEEIGKKLLSSDRILLFCHRRPDGDTLGSAFALRDGLIACGKDARCVCADRAAEKLTFLSDSLLLPSEIPADFVGYFPVAIDVASPDMLNSALDLFRGKETLRIDHHLKGDDFSDYYYVDESAAATGEIIYDLLEKMHALTLPAMEKIFAAISSDTGCFRYRNTTVRSHLIAASLLEAGVNGGEINSLLNDCRSLKELLAESIAVSSMRFFLGGKAAVVLFTVDQMKEYGFSEDDLETVSSIPRTVRGVSIGVTLKQDMKTPQRFRLSVRTDGSFDAAAFCSQFGGGGHFCAAGGTVVAASADEAVSRVLEKLHV